MRFTAAPQELYARGSRLRPTAAIPRTHMAQIFSSACLRNTLIHRLISGDELAKIIEAYRSGNHYNMVIMERKPAADLQAMNRPTLRDAGKF